MGVSFDIGIVGILRVISQTIIILTNKIIS